MVGIAGLLIYLRRRNSRVLSVTLSAEDNQKIDALLNNAGKEGKDS
jgi:cytochrome c-type biogenesis protein CcmH